MKRSLRSAFFLIPAVCTLTVTAFADTGPKSQLVVGLKRPRGRPTIWTFWRRGVSRSIPAPLTV